MEGWYGKIYNMDDKKHGMVNDMDDTAYDGTRCDNVVDMAWKGIVRMKGKGITQ